MASELRKFVTCDVCGAEGATEYAALRAGSAPADVDLCDAHAGPVRALEELLEAHGRGERRARAAGAERVPRGTNSPLYLGGNRRLAERFRTCPKCGTVSNTRQSLSTHARTEHGVALGLLESELGTTYRCLECEMSSRYPVITAHARRTGHALLT